MKNKISFVLILLMLSTGSFSQLNINHLVHTGRSRLYFGNYTGAIDNFNMVLRMHPHLPEPYLYRGAAKFNLEDYRGALKDINKALDIKPFYPEALLYRGMVYYHLNEYDKAMADYTEALNYDRDNADIYNNRGICKAAMRDFEGAISDYSRSIELKPRNYNAFVNRSIAYQIMEEWDKAIDDCNQMIRIRPNSPMGYMSRGLIRIEQENYASAMRDFDMAIYLDPDNAFAYQNRGMVKQQLESYEAAIMDYDRAIELNNRMASAYFNRGIAKEMLGRQSYSQDYEYAAALDPRFADRPWLTKEEQDEARQQMIQAWYNPVDDEENNEQNNTEDEEAPSGINLDDLRRRRMLANLAVEDNRNIPGNQSEEDIRIQDRNINIDIQPYFVLASIEHNASQKESFGYFSLIVEKLNNEYNYQPFLTITNLPATKAQAGDYYQNQILIFNQMISQNPDISNNYLYRGIFHMLNESFDRAISDFDKAVDLNEHNLLAYFMRANTRAGMIEKIEQFSASGVRGLNAQNRPVLSEQAQTDEVTNEAIKEIHSDYSVVLYMNPEFAFANFNRGNVYLRNENYFAAIDEYSKAINIKPEFAEAYYNRGLIKILMNDIEGAARDLSKAGELGIAESYNVIKRYCN